MGLRIRWLGHSTTVLDLPGARVLTDPLLRRHAWPLRRRGPGPIPQTWADTDAVLLSHLHHDHADLQSLRMLPGSPVLTTPRNARWLRRHGVAGVDGRWDRWQPVGADIDVAVRLVPAVHHSRPMPHRPNETCGHLLRSEGALVWVAGDTALFDGMRELPDLAGGPIDLALVPIGGWGPRLSSGHMDPTQAAQACALVRPRSVVPVHWGTLHLPGMRNRPPGWMDRPGELFRREVARLAPGCRALVLRLGGEAEVV
ncbi:MAG TPA: MBL fold metallo-hydrolase [Actinomycetales bacterium]|nr:MBL fold metallo-hydrolase [Actinomycetales bacterium]